MSDPVTTETSVDTISDMAEQIPDHPSRRSLLPGTPSQWMVVLTAILSALGIGGGSMAWYETSSHAQEWRSEHEADEASRDAEVDRRFERIERSLADIRCVVVMEGRPIGECQCRLQDGQIRDLCPSR